MARPPKADDSEEQKETRRLLEEATRAVNALSNHCEKLAGPDAYYAANRALHELWKIKSSK